MLELQPLRNAGEEVRRMSVRAVPTSLEELVRWPQNTSKECCPYRAVTNCSTDATGLLQVFYILRAQIPVVKAKSLQLQV